MTRDIKPATTFEQQIELLKERGLLIDDVDKSKEILSRLNYYTFTGYLHDFKKEDNKYGEGISFDKIYNIIEFDRRFRNILLYGIETIENTFQTKLAYYFAHNYGPLGYLNKSNFKDYNEHEIFIKKFEENKRNNKNMPFIKHHNKVYGGDLPIWVAVEIFTMGMLYHFYRNIPTNVQKEIAKDYNTGTRQIISWMDNITYLRNMIAHYMRLYNFKLQKTPIKCKNNHGNYIDISYKAFDIIHIMMFLILDRDEWNNYIIANLKALITQYEEYIELQSIGFPLNWEEILIKKY